VPIPTMEEIVSRMKTGQRFQVGGDEYRWDDARGEIVVDEGGELGVRSEGQLRQVVCSHPEVFGGTRATVAEVIERLKAGEQIQYGGGRLFEMFGWDVDSNRLYIESVDEGHATRYTCSESRLADAIAESPQVFADVRYK
jgi:hypothetical protein